MRELIILSSSLELQCVFRSEWKIISINKKMAGMFYYTRLLEKDERIRLLKDYGKEIKVIGVGSYGKIYLYHRGTEKYAIKEVGYGSYREL